MEISVSTCIQCNSKRLLSISVECKNLTVIGSTKDGILWNSTDGSVLSELKLGCGGFLDFVYCLDCGVMQNYPSQHPISKESDVIEASETTEGGVGGEDISSPPETNEESAEEMRHKIVKYLEDIAGYIEISEHNLHLKKTDPEKYGKHLWEDDKNGEMEGRWIAKEKEELVKYRNQYEEMDKDDVEKLGALQYWLWDTIYTMSHSTGWKYDSPEYEDWHRRWNDFQTG